MSVYLNKLITEENIIFTGMRKNIPDFLELMDIYVQPSLFENISNSVLEAMAVGLPVIATNVGGINEIITHGKNGLIVKLGSDTAMADAIKLLLSHSGLREKMGRLGRQQVEKSFSIETMVSGYERIYKQIIGNKKF